MRLVLRRRRPRRKNRGGKFGEKKNKKIRQERRAHVDDYASRFHHIFVQCSHHRASCRFLCAPFLLSMRITSPAFCSGEMIPAKYTCDGKDVNPELVIDDVPGDTQSLAVIVDDPSSPSGTWLHWSVWNIPPTVRIIRENSVPQGAREGETDFSEIGYGGPCPGTGEHQYRFAVYALDCVLDLSHGAQLHMIEEAMDGHILAEASMAGKYQRQKIRAMQQHALSMAVPA